MDKLVEDDSFALFQLWSGNRPSPACDVYQKCQVVKTHFVVARNFGGGWMFPKRSPFLPILKHYVGLVKEVGIVLRISSSYAKQNGQECLEYDGDPIRLQKTFSLFAIVLGGMSLSLITFL